MGMNDSFLEPPLHVTSAAPSNAVCHKQRGALRTQTCSPRHSEDPMDWNILSTQSGARP